MNEPIDWQRVGFLSLMKKSFTELKRNDPVRMAGATSFFTTFALPPILIILFQLFTLFLSRRLVGTEMREMLVDTFGTGGANQIRITSRGFQKIAANWWLASIGFLFLAFVATTLLTVIKNTLNDIWKIGIREKRGIMFSLVLRARSLVIILFAGLLFLAGLLLDGFEVLLGKYITQVLANPGQRFLVSALNELVGLLLVTSWFVLLFRYLADARPTWKVATIGGLLTGILFSIGKSILSYLIQHSNINTIYGASGSTVLLLLFIFYSSFILYYGASFIKLYALKINQPLQPLHHAFQYELHEIIDE
jgi:membrane protein